MKKRTRLQAALDAVDVGLAHVGEEYRAMTKLAQALRAEAEADEAKAFDTGMRLTGRIIDLGNVCQALKQAIGLDPNRQGEDAFQTLRVNVRAAVAQARSEAELALKVDEGRTSLGRWIKVIEEA